MAPPIDYETLRLIWWLLMGVLLIGFTLTDGFDLGTAALLPFVAKTDAERRLVINSIGATWEGNQVWFILGGGAIFAAAEIRASRRSSRSAMKSANRSARRSAASMAWLAR